MDNGLGVQLDYKAHKVRREYKVFKELKVHKELKVLKVHKVYREYKVFKVDKVYKGDLNEGDEISVSLAGGTMTLVACRS